MFHRLAGWLRGPENGARLRLLMVYSIGAMLLAAGYVGGILGPIVQAAGWVAGVIAGLAVVHFITAFRTLSGLRDATLDYTIVTAESRLSWLEKIDVSVLALGFLGKLYGIAKITGAVVASGDAAQVMAGLGSVTHGISVALYSTMAGLAISMWTHCGSLVVGNAVAHSRAEWE